VVDWAVVQVVDVVDWAVVQVVNGMEGFETNLRKVSREWTNATVAEFLSNWTVGFGTI
jgi:hypothetical protein